jgi:hypothetical protein
VVQFGATTTTTGEKMEEPPYADLQREVQRKLGKCLIRIQQYEILLKEMVAKREVSAQPVQDCLPPTEPSTAMKTMGQLVGELTEKYFQPTLLESGGAPTENLSDDDQHPAGWVRVRRSVSMPPDTHAKLKEELQELVDLRNDLVHHFVEGQDLVSEEGCIAADMYLHDCYAEIERHLVSLRDWAESSNKATSSMAAFVASPEFDEFLLAEMSPSIGLREAALPSLGELLRRAEDEVAKDGWTALSAAIAFVKTAAPDETPKKHGFGSWRQVLHDSKTFEVRRQPASTRGAVETLYRSRPQVPFGG